MSRHTESIEVALTVRCFCGASARIEGTSKVPFHAAFKAAGWRCFGRAPIHQHVCPDCPDEG